MSITSDRLKDEVNMLDVVKILFNPVKKGSAYFFNCPSPSHEDKHASCYTKDGWKNVYCNSCGYYAQAIDLVQDAKGCSFSEACDELADILGNPEWYGKKTGKTDDGKLTSKDLSLMGLKGINVSKTQLLKMAKAALTELAKKYRLLGKDTSELEKIWERAKKTCC